MNKRKAPRIEVLGHAIILTPKGRLNCIIRDLSATGARVGVSKIIKLPAEFDLYLIKANSARRVLLRWRDGDSAGVEFVHRRPATEVQPRPEAPERWLV
jgi:PilZ domain